MNLLRKYHLFYKFSTPCLKACFSNGGRVIQKTNFTQKLSERSQQQQSSNDFQKHRSTIKDKQFNTKKKTQKTNNSNRKQSLNIEQIEKDNKEQIQLFEQCNDHIINKRYLKAANDIQELLDFLQEGRACSDALHLMELQNSLFFYNRQYMDSYLVRCNISKCMTSNKYEYTKEQCNQQQLKYFYQLIFTHQLQAEIDLDIIYHNYYSTNLFNEKQKALFNLAAAAGHFISSDSQAQEKGLTFTLSCLQNTQDPSILSKALCNLSVYQALTLKTEEEKKLLMQQILQNEGNNSNNNDSRRMSNIQSMKKQVDNILNKILTRQKIALTDLQNPVANLFASLSLNTQNISIYQLGDIINSKEQLMKCQEFSLKSLLFICNQYNIFNISHNKSMRTKLIHCTYQLCNHREENISHSLMLYAALFADIKQISQAKQLLQQVMSNKSNPMDDGIRYESTMLMSVLDFENKYQFKKQAQEIIKSDNLSYYQYLLIPYDLPTLHIFPINQLSLASQQELSSILNSVQFEGDENNDSYEDEDEQDGSDNDDQSDVEEQKYQHKEKSKGYRGAEEQKEREKTLENLNKQLKDLQDLYNYKRK